MIYPDEAPVFAAELAASIAYAAGLQHLKDTNRDYDPDFTWVAVAGGVIISCLPAFVLARIAGGDGGAYERRIVLGFCTSALAIVPWQLWQQAKRKGQEPPAMPTERRRWTSYLEEYRAGAEDAAARAAVDLVQANELITTARRLLRVDPTAANTLLADAQVVISRVESIQRQIENLMLQAKIGRD
jgi:hypothetical protein